MAITDNGTANAVNTVLGFLMPSIRQRGHMVPVSVEDAVKAAEVLAAASSKQMGAGVNPSLVRQAAAVDGVRLQEIGRG